jgi:hypothetical protein
MRLVPDPLLDVGELLGPTAAALGVEGGAVGVAAALELGEEVVGLGLGEEVVGLGVGAEVVALGLGEEVAVTLRLGDKHRGWQPKGKSFARNAACLDPSTRS